MQGKENVGQKRLSDYMKVNFGSTEDHGALILLVFFQAYKKWEKESGPPQRLPGVNMTDDQIFFLASAQVCHRYTPSGREQKH